MQLLDSSSLQWKHVGRFSLMKKLHSSGGVSFTKIQKVSGVKRKLFEYPITNIILAWVSYVPKHLSIYAMYLISGRQYRVKWNSIDVGKRVDFMQKSCFEGFFSFRLYVVLAVVDSTKRADELFEIDLGLRFLPHSCLHPKMAESLDSEPLVSMWRV